MAFCCILVGFLKDLIQKGETFVDSILEISSKRWGRGGEEGEGDEREKYER